MHPQDLRYRHNHTVSREWEDVIATMNRRGFRKVIYDDSGPLIFLLKKRHRTGDPGVVVYLACKTKDPGQNLVHQISVKPDKEFNNIIDQIVCIEYVECLPNKSYFAWNPDTVESEDPNFWFIDEDFLNHGNDVPNIT